jgi:hypothetical protein
VCVGVISCFVLSKLTLRCCNCTVVKKKNYTTAKVAVGLAILLSARALESDSLVSAMLSSGAYSEAKSLSCSANEGAAGSDNTISEKLTMVKTIETSKNSSMGIVDFKCF